jgi:heterodisulfide reductase subunit C
MKVSKFDLTFRAHLAKNPFSRNIYQCYQCGICTGGCPSSALTQLRTRVLMHRATLGIKDVIDADELWLCLMCYKCSNNCRVEIDVANVIAVLRNLAAKEGKAPEAFMRSAKLFYQSGFNFPITRYTEKLRAELNLAPLKVRSDVLQELRHIVEATGFHELWKKSRSETVHKKEAE